MNAFTQAIDVLMRDHATPAAVRAVERGDDPSALWSVVADGGYLELLAPEDRGGADLPWAELRDMVVCMGRHAAPLPWAQSMAVRWLLGDLSDALPAALRSGRTVLASAAQRLDDGAWQADRVPWGAVAQTLVATRGSGLVVVDIARAQRVPVGVHGSLSATLRWDESAVLMAQDGGGDDVRCVAAALHAALLTGAMERCLELTVRHASDRVQFGKPIGRFQAVQQQLAVMAEEVAASRLATAAAFAPGHPGPTALGAAVAKSRCSEAAAEVAAIAHAVHGAIGVTAEYELQLFTRRLHEWRVDHGSEAYWNLRLGEAALAQSLPIAEFVRQLGWRPHIPA